MSLIQKKDYSGIFGAGFDWKYRGLLGRIKYSRRAYGDRNQISMGDR